MTNSSSPFITSSHILRMPSRIICALFILFSALMFASKTYSDSITLDVKDADKSKYKKLFLFPYAFHTDNFGFAGGIGGGTTGYFQDQLSLLGAFMISSNNSFGFYFTEKSLQLPITDRLFLDTEGYITRYTKYREYIDANLMLIENGAGSNNSNKNDYLKGRGWDNQIEPTFLYVLPIGVGLDKPINTYILDHGFLKEGETCRGTWNPFRSGRTFFEVTPFVHWQNFGDSDVPLAKFDSNGAAVAVKYDNTDFYINPTKGSAQRFEVRRDFSMFDSSSAWTSLEFEWSKYISLWECSWFKQHVLALDFWTAYSPTMKYIEENGLMIAKNAPPDYYGAHLGGLYRLRGFNDRRFHDKAGLCYTIEYRMIPQWQPLTEISLLKIFDIDWWEFVLFAEAGRVAPEWNFSTLNSDIKFDGGVSVRVMAYRNIARLDFAFSDEGFSIWAFVGHPF